METMLAKFQKYAGSKSEGTRVYNTLIRALYAGGEGDFDGALRANLPEQNFVFLMKEIKGIGRKAIVLIANVVADVLGE